MCLVFDARSDKRYNRELQGFIYQYLRKSYPAAKLRIQPSDQYFVAPEEGAITLKLKITTYSYMQKPLYSTSIVNNNKEGRGVLTTNVAPRESSSGRLKYWEILKY